MEATKNDKLEQAEVQTPAATSGVLSSKSSKYEPVHEENTCPHERDGSNY